jgi:uncharacterized membrane protein YkvA (DUF1232 family)
MSSIHEFVLRGGQTVTAGQMHDFRRQVPFLQIKAETFGKTDFPHLAEQTRFLARYAEDVLDGVYTSGNLVAITETIFALTYLLKDVDIIPDHVPGQGLADDSAVLRAVLSSHEEEFGAYAEANKLDYSKVTVSA